MNRWYAGLCLMEGVVSCGFRRGFALVWVLLSVVIFPSIGGAQIFNDSFDAINLDSTWTKVDRGDISNDNGILSMKECYVTAGEMDWKNYKMEFKARAPESASEVRIFTSFRYNSDKSRYVFGLRGGNNNDLFLSRIGADNNSILLAIEPLDFIPQKGEWYTVRIQVEENSIQVFLNDEPEARLRAVDASAPFSSGKIALGGGWSTVEFDSVKVSPLSGYKIHDEAVRYNFQTLSDEPVPGWTAVDGSLYSKENGYGWREKGLFTRKRNRSDNQLFDTLVGFSKMIGSKIFVTDLPDGDYVVSLNVGDPRYSSKNRMFFMDELNPAMNAVSVGGGSALLRKSVAVYNGQLRIRFELDDPNVGSSINWLAIETRAQAGDASWAKYLKQENEDISAEKEVLRKAQRAGYEKVCIENVHNSRTVVSLNGDWLFLPDYEVQKGQSPWDPSLEDDSWHMMTVPAFWTPVYNWTYVDDNIARGSANWVEMEVARCSAYTFDYEKAKVGYYKQHMVLPETIAGKTIQLHFESISKCAQIWVNGTLAAVHQGMFAPIDVDVTSLVKPGENIVVVQAGDSADFESGDDTVQGVAVSVEVTSKMLNSLPHGMFKGLNRGIWQDVSLVISDPVTIEDTFFKPQMNHFDLDVTVKNRSESPVNYTLGAQIREHGSNKLIYDHYKSSRTTDINTGGGLEYETKLSSDDSKHADFKLWSPEFPNLYTADIFLYNYNENSAVDLQSHHAKAMKLNFQPLDAPKVSGWVAVDGAVYQSSKGYGWSEELTATDRNRIKNQLSDTLVLANPASEAVFTVDLENGDYLVSLTFGDPAQASLAEAYVGSGVNSIDQAIVRDFKAAGESVVVLKSLTVKNGKLQIMVPGLPAAGEGTSLNTLVIEKRTQVSAAKWDLGLNHFNVLDNLSYNAGFRTFTISGDDFLLNGRPYKIRGANHNPNIIKPNDKKLANWFMKTVHDNNINFTRSHANPFNDIWLDACDEHGVAVSQEGTWPWLFLHGEHVPEEALLKIWKKEWLALINKHKNHPSLLMWTMNNEMKIWSSHNQEPWEILSEAVQAVRALDPTRPVCADSGNCRYYVDKKGGQFEGVDDGDIDDHHYYPNWYNYKTFFTFRDGEAFTEARTPGRPYISQEFSTGYPDADTGHAIKHYIYSHMTPHTLIGKWAYEHQNPKYFLERHALTSKESCEAIRTGYRDTSAGVMIFALCTWFQNLYDVDTITPYPTLNAVAQAWEPVMVSAQLMGRHFYAGSSHTINSVIVNDSPTYETLNDIMVDWDVVYNDTVLHSGRKTYSGSLKYYSNKDEELTFTLPETLPEAKIEAKLVFKLSANGRVISSNSYDICVADPKYVSKGSGLKVGYFTQDDQLSTILDQAGVKTVKVAALSQVNPKKMDVLLVDNLTTEPANYKKILEYAEAGGQVLLSMNRDVVLKLFPEELRGSTTGSKEIVTPCAYGKSIFDGIEPDELSWFTGTENSADSINPGYTPIACERAYNVNANDHTTYLAETMRIHGYVNKALPNGYFPRQTYDEVFGYPLIEISKGKGRIIVSSMIIQTPDDPIAHRLLVNLLNYLAE
jgi:hypothetical protein